MSRLRVNNITNFTQSGPVVLSMGATISSGYALTAYQMRVTGTVNAGTLSGDGSQLTNLTIASPSQIAAIKKLGIWFDDYKF